MFRKSISLLLSICFLFTQTGFAQVASVELNISGHLAALHNSFVHDTFRPIHLRYFSYDSLNNSFKVLLDKGDSDKAKGLSPKGTDPEANLQQETKQLLKYFLIGVTLPNDTFWVNLRPDSPESIIDSKLELTDMGKVLLETDLQLKKDTANFTSPQTIEGKEYWDKLYKKAEELYGTDTVTIPTLTRPWIVPGEIIVRETKDSAYIYKATLKVMLEQDYLKDVTTSPGHQVTGVDYTFKDSRSKALNEYSTQLIKELIIPKLTKEVNTSKKYASLRQVYYSLILSRWFKLRFKQMSPGHQVTTSPEDSFVNLIDKQNLTNLTSKTDWTKDTYFNEYKKSFAQGEYNIKEPVYTPTGQVIRSYFSGGIKVGSPVMTVIPANVESSVIGNLVGSPQYSLVSSSSLKDVAQPAAGLAVEADFSQKVVVELPKIIRLNYERGDLRLKRGSSLKLGKKIIYSYTIYKNGEKIPDSCVEINETFNSVAIPSFYVGLKDKIEQTGKGIGKAILQYMYEYSTFVGKDVYITDVSNLALLTIADSISQGRCKLAKIYDNKEMTLDKALDMIVDRGIFIYIPKLLEAEFKIKKGTNYFVCTRLIRGSKNTADDIGIIYNKTTNRVDVTFKGGLSEGNEPEQYQLYLKDRIHIHIEVPKNVDSNLPVADSSSASGSPAQKPPVAGSETERGSSSIEIEKVAQCERLIKDWKQKFSDLENGDYWSSGQLWKMFREVQNENNLFALHGNLLADEYGQGILILGDNQIGKSTLTIKLLRRKKQLKFISDDSIIFTVIGKDMYAAAAPYSGRDNILYRPVDNLYRRGELFGRTFETYQVPENQRYNGLVKIRQVVNLSARDVLDTYIPECEIKKEELSIKGFISLLSYMRSEVLKEDLRTEDLNPLLSKISLEAINLWNVTLPFYKSRRFNSETINKIIKTIFLPLKRGKIKVSNSPPAAGLLGYNDSLDSSSAIRVESEAEYIQALIDTYYMGYKWHVEYNDTKISKLKELQAPEVLIERQLELKQIAEKKFGQVKTNIDKLKMLMQEPTLDSFQKALMELQGKGSLRPEQAFGISVVKEKLQQEFDFNSFYIMFISERSWVRTLFNFTVPGRIIPLDINGKYTHIILINDEIVDPLKIIKIILHEIYHTKFISGRELAGTLQRNDRFLYHILEEAKVEELAIFAMMDIAAAHPELQRMLAPEIAKNRLVGQYGLKGEQELIMRLVASDIYATYQRERRFLDALRRDYEEKVDDAVVSYLTTGKEEFLLDIMGKRLNDGVFITGVIRDKYNSSEYALGLYALERMSRNPSNAVIPVAVRMLLEFLQQNELDIYERLDSLVQSAEFHAGHEGAEFKLMRKIVATAAVRTLDFISRKYNLRTISQVKAKELFYQFIDEQAKRLQVGSSPFGERIPPSAGSAINSDPGRSALAASDKVIKSLLRNFKKPELIDNSRDYTYIAISRVVDAFQEILARNPEIGELRNVFAIMKSASARNYIESTTYSGIAKELARAIKRGDKVRNFYLEAQLSSQPSEGKSGSPLVENPGGIDFRSLPIVTQAVSNLSPGISSSALLRLSAVNLDAEWQQIERMSSSGIKPSPERIKEYAQASSASGKISEDRDKIILCISDILRQEEQDCCETESTLRDILVVLESVQQPQELKRVFLGTG